MTAKQEQTVERVAAKLMELLKPAIMYEWPGSCGVYRVDGEADMPALARAALEACEYEEMRKALVLAVACLRDIAVPVGPLHSFWDVIFDAEAVMARQEGCAQEREQ